jgi:hypothetical protein
LTTAIVPEALRSIKPERRTAPGASLPWHAAQAGVDPDQPGQTQTTR